jgi:hypothetical protein
MLLMVVFQRMNRLWSHSAECESRIELCRQLWYLPHFMTLGPVEFLDQVAARSTIDCPWWFSGLSRGEVSAGLLAGIFLTCVVPSSGCFILQSQTLL